MRNIFASLICAVGFASLPGCAWHGSSVQGQILEIENPDSPPLKWKKTPASGAFVIVQWSGTVPRPVDATSVCLHTSITKADENGRFAVPGWWALPKPYPVIGIYAHISAYKPTYLVLDSPNDELTYLRREHGNAEDRLFTLEIMSDVGCWDDKKVSDPENQLGAYYIALYEEALRLDVTSRGSAWSLDALRMKSESTPAQR